MCWDPCTDTFTIHRPQVDILDVNHGYESAPHTLFTLADEQGGETEECLRVHAYFDSGVLEVFVNERTVITTRIYHPENRCFGLRFSAKSNISAKSNMTTIEAAAVLLRADVWDNLHL